MIVSAWLIRHGQSVANAGGRTSDPVSTPLSELGKRQAAAVQLPRKPKRIVVSRFLRTRQTAEPTIARYPDVPVEVWPIEEATFLDPAKYADTTEAERRPHIEAFYERNDPYYHDGGEAESFYDVLNRAAETLERLKQDRDTVVFTHGRFLQLLRWVHGGRTGTPKEFRDWSPAHEVPNLAVTTLGMTLVPRGWVMTPPQESFNHQGKSRV